MNITLQPTLFFSAAFSWLVAGIYWYVGRRLARRRIESDDARFAWWAFTIWWYSLAATTFASGSQSLLGAFGVDDLPIFLAITHLSLLLVCIALWGLLYYLIYLFTGSARARWPLTAFYVAYYIFLDYYIAASAPMDVELARWNAQLAYRTPLTGPLFAITLFLLILPQIVGSLAYFSLFFRLHDTAQQYRIALVSWSIILWFGSGLAASLSGLAQLDWWQIASRAIGLSAA
ncbi:MAG: hypothetical protein AB1750_05175, partial [Chloroflexota bacterium]